MVGLNMKKSKIKILTKKEMKKLGEVTKRLDNKSVVHHVTLNGFDFDFTISVESQNRKMAELMKNFVDWDLKNNPVTET
jgi:hypothetical protein